MIPTHMDERMGYYPVNLTLQDISFLEDQIGRGSACKEMEIACQQDQQKEPASELLA